MVSAGRCPCFQVVDRHSGLGLGLFRNPQKKPVEPRPQAPRPTTSPQSSAGTMPRVLNSLHSSNLSCPVGSYIYSLAPATPDSLAAICSDDSLRLFSPSGLALQGTVAKTHDGVTCLKAVDTNILATAGLDGAVRVWDPRVGGDKPRMVYKNGLALGRVSVGVVCVNAGSV